jgi:two-component system response regulator YesN
MSKQKSILIIDDDIGIRDGLSVLLGKYFIIGTASSGEEALEIIKSSDYDIYIIDIFPGDLSGFDILKEIKKNKPNARTIMLTGFGSDEDIELAKKLGADEFLHKPITFSRLKNVIDNINNNKTNYTKVSPISLSLHKVIRNSNLEILKASNNINQVIKVLADECPDNENRLKEINKFNAIVKLTVIFIDYYIKMGFINLTCS